MVLNYMSFIFRNERIYLKWKEGRGKEYFRHCGWKRTPLTFFAEVSSAIKHGNGYQASMPGYFRKSTQKERGNFVALWVYWRLIQRSKPSHNHLLSSANLLLSLEILRSFHNQIIVFDLLLEVFKPIL